MKFEVFERLNTGGLALNAQEIRNAIYSGPLNNLLKELEVDEAFRKCLGTERPRKRMVDRELVLRFLAMSDALDAYRPPLVRFLNDYMRSNRDATSEWLQARRQHFQAMVALMVDVLGSSAFRAIDTAGTPVERNINRAVFDAQTLIFSVADADRARSRAKPLVRQLGKLFENENFNDAIRRATGDRTRTLERIRDVSEAFRAAGVPVSVEDYKSLS